MASSIGSVATQLFSPLEIQSGMTGCLQALTQAHSELTEKTHKAAKLDRDYRVAQAKAFLQTQEGTQEARKMTAQAMTADQRFESHLANSEREAALERIRSLREELRAWNGLAFLVRSEMELSR